MISFGQREIFFSSLVIDYNLSPLCTIQYPTLFVYYFLFCSSSNKIKISWPQYYINKVKEEWRRAAISI